MRIAVFGTGAVGGYFGGRLAQAGEDVTFVARGEHLAALQGQGLRVSSVAGDFVVQPARATGDPSKVGTVDAVLVAVKAWQVSEAATALRPMIGPDTVVVPLQNGVEAPGQLADALGPEHVLGGLCRILGRVEGPGHIGHFGAEPYIAFGALDGSRSAPAERLLKAFNGTVAVTAEIPADIRAAMWSKFIFIATMSGIGAVTRAPIGILRSQPETRQLLEQALREVHSVAIAQSIALPSDIVATTLAFMDSLPAEGTASLQRDVMQGRPSELEAQIGAVVRLGERAGVEVPLYRTVYHALLPLERKARGELEFTA